MLVATELAIGEVAHRRKRGIAVTALHEPNFDVRTARQELLRSELLNKSRQLRLHLGEDQGIALGAFGLGFVITVRQRAADPAD